MDKNTILGLLLMGLVIIGFTMLNSPDDTTSQASEQKTEKSVAAEKKQEAVVGDSLNATELGRIKTIVAQYGKLEMREGKQVYALDANDVSFALVGDSLSGQVVMDGDMAFSLSSLAAMPDADSRLLHNAAVKKVREAAEKAAKYSDFARFVSGKSDTLRLENSLLSLDLTTKGGMISKAELKNYKAFQKGKEGNCVLFESPYNAYGFAINTDTHRFSTEDFYFTPVQENDSTVLMKLDFGKDVYFGIRYTLPHDSYLVRMEVVQQNMSAVIDSNVSTMDFMWSQKMMRHEKGQSFEERNSGVFYKFSGEDGDVDNLSETGDDEEKTNNHLKWIGFKYQFFSCVFIADTHFIGAAPMTSEIIEKGDADHGGFMKNVSFASSVDYSLDNPKPAAFHIFLGPNEYKLLASYDSISPEEDLHLTRLIPLGWPLFRWINTGIIIPVFNFLGTLDLNYGIIILLLTIFIKIVLFPLTYKSYSSQAKMRVLAPDIKEINDKYPGNENAMKRQQKMMELYNRAGANPMSGCLPLLLQMPILIAMFSFFPSCIDLRGEPFLWAPDLSAPDMILEWDADIPIVNWIFGHHLSLFCLLMTVVNVIYTYLNMQANPSNNQMPAMKWMMYLMPVFFLVFFNEYAAGLSYYYFLSLLITIAQTYAFRFIIKEDKVRAKMAENAKKPRKKSGFMARLEEAQKRQEALLREQQKQRKGGRR